MPDHFLVTSAMGCIGAWVVRNLVREGTPRENSRVVAFDLATDPKRIKLLLDPDELNRVTFITGDVTDLPDLERALDEHAITHLIHLAALQIPFCRADPPLARVIGQLPITPLAEGVAWTVNRFRERNEMLR